jgi:putative heme iron utilization protein
MSVDNSAPAPGSASAAAAARRLVRTALKGSLGTLDRGSGHPYASLVLFATEPDGTPIFLISRLALHTRNLEKDARASLLIDGTAVLDDPMTGGRLTLMGQVRRTSSTTALRRFLARQAGAQRYASLPDFAMFALEIVSGHYIGGFGKIFDLTPAQVLTDVADAQDLIAAETDIISHMNRDHADAVALYATQLAQGPPGAWRMSGIDPTGADLLHCSNAARLEFPRRVCTSAEARTTLIALVQEARSRPAARSRT